MVMQSFIVRNTKHMDPAAGLYCKHGKKYHVDTACAMFGSHIMGKELLNEVFLLSCDLFMRFHSVL